MHSKYSVVREECKTNGPANSYSVLCFFFCSSLACAMDVRWYHILIEIFQMFPWHLHSYATNDQCPFFCCCFFKRKIKNRRNFSISVIVILEIRWNYVIKCARRRQQKNAFSRLERNNWHVFEEIFCFDAFSMELTQRLQISISQRQKKCLIKRKCVYFGAYLKAILFVSSFELVK